MKTNFLAIALTTTFITANLPPVQGAVIRGDSGFNDNTLGPIDDLPSALYSLGFAINFFGSWYSDVYVNNNGNITFGEASPTFDPSGMAGATLPIIAPFFADVDTTGPGSGVVRYGSSTVNGHSAFGVNSLGVGYFNQRTDKLNSFQMVLIYRGDTGAGNFDIEFNYGQIQWETGDASGGNGGLGGHSAVVGFSNGSGNYWEYAGSGVPGALLDSNPTTGLIFNNVGSGEAGRYTFEVRNGVVAVPELSNQALLIFGVLAAGTTGWRAWRRQRKDNMDGQAGRN
ncbi:MAG: VPLPA-CTERM sorting domain-containing protein, partial [Verrucomicrobia bacterium]|nr:VPLPA-CTERM sorting domain-containing protein [Verrucomicrobiota bacterium]